MRFRFLRLPTIAVLLLAQLSCAAGHLTPLQESMPAARAGLRPEYRLFYDVLGDAGDWTLIEPYGYVFRPDVNMLAWRPYEDGFWAPNDVYGWVWISAEPFGWATYHYGRWFYDRFQGWVWVPGADWGPAWVAWADAGDYVGWSPLLAAGTGSDAVPGGDWRFVSTADLGATNLRARTLPASELGSRVADAQPVRNLVGYGGVTFNAGPRIDVIERRTGPLQRVRIDDLVSPAGAPRGPTSPDLVPRTTAPGADQADAIRRAAEQAAREARGMTEQDGDAPPRVSIVRPVVAPAPPAEERPAPRPPKRRQSRAGAAAVDSTAR